MDTQGRDEMRISREEYFYHRCPAWLTEAIFSKDRVRVAAAESNLRRALRSDEGRDAALIAIGGFPDLTRRFLPRVWAVRQAQVAVRALLRGRRGQNCVA
jgi:CTP:molybdopterin cytidylyltransferase MocA